MHYAPQFTDFAGSEANLRGDVVGLPFSDGEFQRIRELIYREAGISLSASKKELAYSRLVRRLRARRMDSFSEYLELVESGDRSEREAFINSLTTNTTSFFRESHHFDILVRHLNNGALRRNISIWSCASSTGEEPYSIAMTLAESFPGQLPAIRILATDIDTNVLNRASQGIYTQEQVHKLPPATMKRFFLRGERDYSGFVRVRPEIAQLVSFRRLNLLERKWPMDEKFDAIFCRNVMIYFDKKTQFEVLKRLRPHLKDDGLLFVGHSECLHHAGELFRACGKTVYAPNTSGKTNA